MNSTKYLKDNFSHTIKNCSHDLPFMKSTCSEALCPIGKVMTEDLAGAP